MTDVTDDLLFQRNPSTFLLYVADNLAYLPYNTQEEPLFVVHHIDMTISVTGSNLLQQFKEIFSANGKSIDDDEEDVHNLCESPELVHIVKMSCNNQHKF